jgi:hypothetical protein
MYDKGLYIDFDPTSVLFICILKHNGDVLLKKSFVAFHDNDADTPFAVQLQVAPNIVTDVICNLNTSKFKAAQIAYHQEHLCALLRIFQSIYVHASSFSTF